MQQIIYETGFPALLYFYTPTNVDSSEKFEALWYCQSIEMLRVFKLSKHFHKIWDCYKSSKKFGWKWIYLHDIIRKRCESLYSGCSSIWGVHSPIFVASGGGPISEALLANGLPQKKIIQRSIFCKQFLAPWQLPVKQIIELKSSRSKGEAISLCEGNAWSCFPTLVFSNNRLFLSSPWKHYLIFLPFPLKTYRAREL